MAKIGRELEEVIVEPIEHPQEQPEEEPIRREEEAPDKEKTPA